MVQQFPAIEVYEPFAVVAEDVDIRSDSLPLVAIVRTTDKGLTVRCDEASVLDTVSKLARSLGANVVKIKEHRPPSTYGSSCHRIEAHLHRSTDAAVHEKVVPWHDKRPLRIEDFRGDTVARPFRAATVCGISCATVIYGRNELVKVEAIFDHDGSYFKRAADDLDVLAHEQTHFDIAEVYARVLRKRIGEAALAGENVSSMLESMHAMIDCEMRLEQDRYDTEVYADASMQATWIASVAARLDELRSYQDHVVALRGR